MCGDKIWVNITNRNHLVQGRKCLLCSLKIIHYTRTGLYFCAPPRNTIKMMIILMMIKILRQKLVDCILITHNNNIQTVRTTSSACQTNRFQCRNSWGKSFDVIHRGEFNPVAETWKCWIQWVQDNVSWVIKPDGAGRSERNGKLEAKA